MAHAGKETADRRGERQRASDRTACGMAEMSVNPKARKPRSSGRTNVAATMIVVTRAASTAARCATVSLAGVASTIAAAPGQISTLPGICGSTRALIPYTSHVKHAVMVIVQDAAETPASPRIAQRPGQLRDDHADAERGADIP